MDRFVNALLVGAMAVVSTAAAAADLPYRKAPAQAAAAFDWSGFYAGVNAGGAWYDGGAIAGSSNIASILPPANIVRVPVSNTNTAGATVGGLLGYNRQIGAAVLGFETDFNYVDIKSQRAGSTTGGSTQYGGLAAIPGSVTLSADSSSKVTWFGTVRGRLGFLPTERILVYGTGGLAYGEVETSTLHSSVFSSGAPSRIWQGNNSDIKVGWTAGAGGEYAVTNNVTLRAEYLYVDLGTSSVVTRYQGPADIAASQIVYTSSRDSKFSVVRAAISYKF